ncbi:MAG: hypothetical protein ACOX3J_07585 [Clostridia bacterium]|jgi:hypothetical protein
MTNDIKFQPLKDYRRSVILDTDIGPDVDDVGAIATLYTLAERYNIPVAGIINCTSNDYGSGAIDALSCFCGYPDVPVGQYEKKDFLAESIFYNKFLSEHFSERYMSKTLKVYGAVELYRKILANAEDNSTIIITIGPLTTLYDLFESKADSYSDLTGRELVKKKVYSIVSVACEFPEGLDWNVKMAVAAAKGVFDNCPVPVFYSGHEFGKRFKTGFNGYIPGNWQSNPVYHSYNLYINGRWPEKPRENNCWDLTAVHFAFEGEGEYYSISNNGKAFIKEDGSNTFEYCMDGNQCYIKNKCTLEELEKELNSCMRRG